MPQASELHDLHWLVVIVGMSNAEALCDYFRGASLKLPIEVNALLQLRNEAIAADYKNGDSVSHIANVYQIDRKLVQKILDIFGLRGKVNTQDSIPQMNLI